MLKEFIGKVKKAKMTRSAVVHIDFVAEHPVYKKLLRRKTKLMVDTGTFEVKEGDTVKIQKTAPISRHKHFKIVEVIKI
jgi:small subunit ribosomal protein S17